eukprot:scaffold3141_cov53-Attheya_sp.AAC.10
MMYHLAMVSGPEKSRSFRRDEWGLVGPVLASSSVRLFIRHSASCHSDNPCSYLAPTGKIVPVQ